MLQKYPVFFLMSKSMGFRQAESRSENNGPTKVGCHHARSASSTVGLGVSAAEVRREGGKRPGDGTPGTVSWPHLETLFKDKNMVATYGWFQHVKKDEISKREQPQLWTKLKKENTAGVSLNFTPPVSFLQTCSGSRLSFFFFFNSWVVFILFFFRLFSTE